MNATHYKKYIGILGLGIALGVGYFLSYVHQIDTVLDKNNNATNAAVFIVPQATSVPTEIKKDIIYLPKKITETTKIVSATLPTINIEDGKKEENKISQQIKINSDDVQDILASHNTTRSGVSVAPITYSASLAQDAQGWAGILANNGCEIRHAPSSVRKGAGENIWYGSGYSAWNIRDMVQDWLNEKLDYDYTQNTCAAGKVCGHYTQAVWSKTNSVGCGIASCDSDSARIFVCRYSPAGNVIGQKPY